MYLHIFYLHITYFAINLTIVNLVAISDLLHLYMYGCFSLCLVTCKLDNFLKNRTIKLLKGKLLPDFYHGFFWFEENVHLNYFPTHNGVTVGLHYDIIGYLILLMADVKPFFVYLMYWLMLLPRYCGRSYCHSCGRCYGHNDVVDLFTTFNIV